APKITILDNETAVFTANLAASSVYEGEIGTANLNINIFPFWSQYHQLFVKAEIISDDGTELSLGTSPLFFEYKNNQGTKTSGLSTSLNFSTLKDNIRDGDQNVRVRFTIEKMNYGNWNGSSVTWDSFVQSTVFTDLTAEVVVNVVDIDVPLIKVSETKKSILEGASSTVAVSLPTQPTESVTVNASSLSKFTLSPTSLTFTNSNWNTPQTVTINGTDNSIIGSNASETLVFSDVASVYQNSQAVTLDLLDNDATLIITDLKTGVTSTINDIVRNTFLNQKTDPSFKVVLPVKPNQNVKVSFSTNGFGTTATTNSRIQGLIQPIATLTFTPDNWNIPQVVNIISNDKDASGNSISFFNNYITSLTVATTADSDPSYLNLSYKLDLSIKITSVNITSSHTWTNRKEYLIKQYSNASPLPTQDSRLDNCEMLKNGQSAIFTLPYSNFSPTDPSKLYLKLDGTDGPIYTTLNQSVSEYGWVSEMYESTSRVLSMPLSTQVLQELIAIGSYTGNTGGIQLPLVVKEGEIANDATNITHGTITTGFNLEKGKTCDTSPPNFLGLSSFIDVPENTVYVVNINTDEVVTLSLSGDDAAKFEIISKVLKFKTAPDYETKLDLNADNKYQVSVIATDAAGNVATRAITVTVTDVSDAPIIITGPNGATGSSVSISVPENSATVSTFSATETVTWTLTGADAAKFFVNSSTGVLTFKSTYPDFEDPTDANRDNIYEVTLTASVISETTIRTTTMAVSVTVTDVDEIVPLLTATGATSVAPPNTIQTALNQTTIYDFDANKSNVIFSLSGTDASSFTISSTGVLSLNNGATSKSNYSLVVTVTDGLNRTDSKTISIVTPIIITGPNGATGSSVSISVPENSAPVSTFSATEIVTWTLTGADAAKFFVGSSTGVLVFKSTYPDFENPTDVNRDNIYEVTLTASVISETTIRTTTMAVSVTITDIDDVKP
ncbi:MAG: hypothetical protein ACK4X2_10815, partial [Bacteroidota bacterium]